MLLSFNIYKKSRRQIQSPETTRELLKLENKSDGLMTNLLTLPE